MFNYLVVYTKWIFLFRQNSAWEFWKNFLRCRQIVARFCVLYESSVWNYHARPLSFQCFSKSLFACMNATCRFSCKINQSCHKIELSETRSFLSSFSYLLVKMRLNVSHCRHCNAFGIKQGFFSAQTWIRSHFLATKFQNVPVPHSHLWSIRLWAKLNDWLECSFSDQESGLAEIGVHFPVLSAASFIHGLWPSEQGEGHLSASLAHFIIRVQIVLW